VKIHFRVEGEAKPQPRERFRSLLPAADTIDKLVAAHGSGQPLRRALAPEVMTMPYPDDKACQLWKAAVRVAWRKAGAEYFEGLVGVRILLALKFPTSLIRKTIQKPREWDSRKSSPGGDVDNFAKSVMDALLNLAYDDDSQVASLLVEKVRCHCRESPHATVEIFDLPTYELPGGEEWAQETFPQT
jgi:Holliday junction resolvase RusA-like endonuclease